MQADIDRWSKGVNVETEADADDSLSFYQREYLIKIAALCKSRNVEMILINTQTYKSEIYGRLDKPEDFRNAYLPEVTYWDYFAFPLPNDCYAI